jgi:hypothetical protein
LRIIDADVRRRSCADWRRRSRAEDGVGERRAWVEGTTTRVDESDRRTNDDATAAAAAAIVIARRSDDGGFETPTIGRDVPGTTAVDDDDDDDDDDAGALLIGAVRGGR